MSTKDKMDIMEKIVSEYVKVSLRKSGNILITDSLTGFDVIALTREETKELVAALLEILFESEPA